MCKGLSIYLLFIIESLLILDYLVCFSHNGFYPYPLFAMLDNTQRAGLFAVSAVMMAGSTAAIRQVYRAVNGGGTGVKAV